ncbi:hypothetical protein OnM2_072018 [Erysiphe neolycopersici]|uniref:DUF788-domain-containing protein n=1 Tax=Erysiphe neolycopersici TaxID=212602 RepID=A0A420HK16_9PEZI|nr:hypothetical protein OnM2_072018 [Erysiphe neolycopersici]
MAQKSKKERAKKNASTLNNLHLGTLSVNILFLFTNLVFFKRSLLAYILFSIPSLIAEYILETTGRPKHDNKTKVLMSSGEDLSAPGLTDYMFDIVYVTWISIFCVLIFGNWGWLVWTSIPLYGAYKGFKLLMAARGMMNMQKEDGNPMTRENRAQRRAK